MPAPFVASFASEAFAPTRLRGHIPPMAQSRTILIVDDDEDLRGALAEQIDLEDDFKTVQAKTAGDGVAMAKEIRPDLIRLDVDRPDMDGREACRQMREDGVLAPVIMLTAAASDADTVQGL